MADSTIANLGDAVTILNTDLVPIQRGAGNRYFTITELMTYVSATGFSTLTIATLTSTTVNATTVNATTVNAATVSATTVSGNPNFSGNVTVAGTTTLNGAATVNNTFHATGAATLDSTLAVTGVLTTTGGLATGTSLVSTPVDTDNSTKAASTAFVKKYAPSAKIQPLTATLVSGALTIAIAETYLDFRSNLASGTVSSLVVPASTITVPPSVSLGYFNAADRIYVVVFNVSGTFRYGVTLGAGVNLDESTLLTSSVISFASINASVVYTDTAAVSTPSPFRVLGYVDAVWSVSNWSSITNVQGVGGQSCTAVSTIGNSQKWQTINRIATGPSPTPPVVYYNSSGRPITIAYTVAGTSNSWGDAVFYVGNIPVGHFNVDSEGAGAPTSTLYAVIPNNTNYWFTTTFNNGYSFVGLL